MESPLCPADPQFRLIETFGYVPGQGVARLDLHLDRMGRSAQAFDIPFDRTATQRLVTGFSATTPKRCRLTLSAKGEAELTNSPMAASPNSWRVALAPQRLNSADPWLRHKTTRRTLYDKARAALPAGIDELLFLNERDELCEGTITNLFITTATGEHLTPALSSGVLPGILRQELLTQTYRENPLTLHDLRTATSIHMGNALRGLIAATLDVPTQS